LASDGSGLNVHWRVRGRVQGVGYRWFVREAALRSGVRGAVRNLDDGSVEVRACGADEALERLRRAVERGPRGSRVDAVDDLDADDGSESGHTSFTIRS